MSRTPTKGIDYTSKDYESFRSDMIKQLGIKMPEYTDIRQSDAGIVLLELLAQGLDVISYYQDVLANEVFLSTAQQRSNALKWCQMLGYIPKASTPSEFTQVFVLSSAQTTDTIIPMGTRVKTQGSSAESEIIFETASDLVIPAGKLGNEMQDDKYLYAVKVLQGVSVSAELLGSSTGTKDQSFKLNYTPVILDSVLVMVNEGSGFEKWDRVDSFIDSDSTSKVYTVTINDNDEATITFGDGVFGKIPFAYNNGIYCSYRVGGGTQGNVGAMKIRLLDSNIAVVKETFNPYTADVEGHNKESLGEIKVNAPAHYRTKWTAFTLNDFSDVMKLNFPEVEMARAYPAGSQDRDIDLYVLLKNGRYIGDAFTETVYDFFDENKGGRKIIGTGYINLLNAVRTPIDISAMLLVKERYDFDTVKAEITAFLEDYFALGNYPFNKELFVANLHAEIMNPANGIDGILYLEFTSPTQRFLIPENGELFTLGTVNITNGGA